MSGQSLSTGIRTGIVTVRAPARLHMGFLDLNGAMGRRFGSLGLTLDHPATHLTVRRAERLQAHGPDADRAHAYGCRLLAELGLDIGVDVEVHEAIPEHSGLGSGTQMALAVGMGIAHLAGVAVEPSKVASFLGRGARSGIGVGAFEQGGFIVDGGRGDEQTVPPVLCRLPCPEDWCVMLVLDRTRCGFNGSAEQEAFTDLPEFPAEQAAHLCRLTLMRMLPALIEQDLSAFGSAISELQLAIGSHFAPVQGGNYTSPIVARVVRWLSGREASGIGQSSWGPTGFALFESEALARQCLRDAERRWPRERPFELMLCRPRNRPAEIVVSPGGKGSQTVQSRDSGFSQRSRKYGVH